MHWMVGLANVCNTQGPAFVVGVLRRVSLAFMGTPPPILLGSLGMADSLILMVLALVVFGPRRLPQIGKQIGKLMYEFRKASNDFKFQMEEELRLSEDADRRKKEEEQRKRIALTQPAQESVSTTPSIADAVPSPYPGEESYPPVIGAGVTSSDEEAPRIATPSVGETVAAKLYSEPAPPLPTAVPTFVPDPIGQIEQPGDTADSPAAAKPEDAPAMEAARPNG